MSGPTYHGRTHGVTDEGGTFVDSGTDPVPGLAAALNTAAAPLRFTFNTVSSNSTSYGSGTLTIYRAIWDDGFGTNPVQLYNTLGATIFTRTAVANSAIGSLEGGWYRVDASCYFVPVSTADLAQYYLQLVYPQAALSANKTRLAASSQDLHLWWGPTGTVVASTSGVIFIDGDADPDAPPYAVWLDLLSPVATDTISYYTLTMAKL